MVYESLKAEDTFKIGEKLGMEAKAGDVFCLYGDLGVGKTVFSQGFARGLGIHETINSPTFTIVQVYEDGRLPFYHFDVYRIADEEEMYEIGFDDMIEGEGVALIEWADLIKNLLPANCQKIYIEKDLDKGFDYRKITVTKE